jgi:hypothetical protein
MRIVSILDMKLLRRLGTTMMAAIRRDAATPASAAVY